MGIRVLKWIVKKYGVWELIIQMHHDNYKSWDTVNAEITFFVLVQVVDFFFLLGKWLSFSKPLLQEGRDKELICEKLIYKKK